MHRAPLFRNIVLAQGAIIPLLRPEVKKLPFFDESRFSPTENISFLLTNRPFRLIVQSELMQPGEMKKGRERLMIAGCRHPGRHYSQASLEGNVETRLERRPCRSIVSPRGNNSENQRFGCIPIAAFCAAHVSGRNFHLLPALLFQRSGNRKTGQQSAEAKYCRRANLHGIRSRAGTAFFPGHKTADAPGRFHGWGRPLCGFSYIVSWQVLAMTSSCCSLVRSMNFTAYPETRIVKFAYSGFSGCSIASFSFSMPNTLTFR